MGFYLSRDLRKISKNGLDRRWFKFKRLYVMLEERARGGYNFMVLDHVAVQELEFLEDEKFNYKLLDKTTNTYEVSW